MTGMRGALSSLDALLSVEYGRVSLTHTRILLLALRVAWIEEL